MDPRRAQTERDMLPKVGASFFREDGKVLFRFVIDSGNVMGPRPATRDDQKKHPDAWTAFVAAEGVSVLDRDAEGGSGGSLPQESPAVPVKDSPLTAPNDDLKLTSAAVGSLIEEVVAKPRRKYTRHKKG